MKLGALLAVISLGLIALTPVAHADANHGIGRGWSARPQSSSPVATAVRLKEAQRPDAALDRTTRIASTGHGRALRNVLYFITTTTKGGSSGAFFPGNLTADAAKRKLATFTHQDRKADPLILGIMFSVQVKDADLKPIRDWLKSKVDIQARPTPPKPQKPTPDPNILFSSYWQPADGVTQMLDESMGPPGEYARLFRTQVSWNYQAGLEEYAQDLPTDRYVFEFDNKLRNLNLPAGSRGTDCFGEYNDQFWAARTNDNNPADLSTGAAQYYGSTFPPDAQFYPDTADYDDDCNTIDFSWGVGNPEYLTAGVDYFVTVGTDAGVTGGNEFSLGVQRLQDDCEAEAIASSCIGLPPPGPGEYDHVITQWPDYRTPQCVGYELDTSKPFDSPGGTFMYGVPDKWNQGEWRYGEPDEEIQDYCGGQ